MAEQEKEIKEAIDVLEGISSDEEKARIAELREKYIMDRESEMETAREIGIEEGRKEGIKEGIEQGIKQGKKDGMREKTETIAKKMKQLGIGIDQIIEITELSKEEIEKL